MKIEDQVPYVYVDKILSEIDRVHIISFIKKQHNINKVKGGTLIIEKDKIYDIKVLQILEGLILYFDKKLFPTFSNHLPSKITEIEQRSKIKITKYKTELYGPFISICEPGHTINAHRDDYYQFIICIIYLGHLDNTLAQTTSILDGEQILSFYENDIEIVHEGNYEEINRINFDYTNNGALFFLNNQFAFHMVNKPFEKERATIMFSIEIKINEV